MLREDEEEQRAAIVDVSRVEFLDHRDGLVDYGIPLRRALAAALRRLQPEVIITISFDLTSFSGTWRATPAWARPASTPWGCGGIRWAEDPHPSARSMERVSASIAARSEPASKANVAPAR